MLYLDVIWYPDLLSMNVSKITGNERGCCIVFCSNPSVSISTLDYSIASSVVIERGGNSYNNKGWKKDSIRKFNLANLVGREGGEKKKEKLDVSHRRPTDSAKRQ